MIRVLLTLVRREFWEHRSLFWVPVIVSSLFISAAVLSMVFNGSVSVTVNGEDQQFFAVVQADPIVQGQIFAVWMGGLAFPQFGIGLVIIFFYLLDCLYGERRDRSILFWKSLPVSDASTVLSKVVVALLIVPLWIWVMSMIAGLSIFAVLSSQLDGTPLQALGTFSVSSWFALQGMLLGNILVAGFWFAPVVGYLLVVSAFAKRSPFLWATLPPLVLAFAERAILGSAYVGQFLLERLNGFFRSFIIFDTRTHDMETMVASIADAYRSLSALPLLTQPETWFGLTLGIFLLFIAARVRRWRDDAL